MNALESDKERSGRKLDLPVRMTRRISGQSVLSCVSSWFLAGFLATFVTVSARGQLVADGATNILDGTISNLTGSLTIGTNASFTHLEIANNSTVTNATAYIGYNASSRSNSVVVNGASSQWSHGTLYLGYSGSANTLVITNGGRVSNTSCSLGYLGSSSNNSAVVTGTNSSWTLTGSLSSGKGGTNTIIVTNGATISSSGASLGMADAAIITGPESSWSNSSFTLSHNSTLVITNGGAMFTAGSGGIGPASGRSGNIVVVSDPGSMWQHSTLSIGTASTNNQLTVANGARIVSSSANIGSSGSNNLALVTGANSLWTNSLTLAIGASGFSNQLMVSKGGRVVVRGSCTVGSGAGFPSNPGSWNGIIVTGGDSVLNIRDDLRIGTDAPENYLVVSNGGSVVANRLVIGNLVSNWVTVSGGQLTVTNEISVRGALVLNSGVIRAGAVHVLDSFSELVFTGGTLHARTLVIPVHRLDIGDGSSPAILEMLEGGTNHLSRGLLVSSNAMLKGDGVIKGDVSVAAGGMISPGSSIGTIVIQERGAVLHHLVLSNGSTTIMELNLSAGDSDRISVSGNLTFGGTLQLMNIGGALSQSKTFTLFSASSFTGAFTEIIADSPGPGWQWDMSRLSTDGTVDVIAVATGPPVITPTSDGSSVIFAISGGNAFAACYLLTSTNISVPVSDWFRVQTNFFNSNGVLNFSEPIPIGESQRFFKVQVH